MPQQKQTVNFGVDWLAKQKALKDSADKYKNLDNTAMGAQIVDATVSHLYGPVADYGLNATNLWDAFAGAYGAGQTYSGRNITNTFDPQDWAEEQSHAVFNEKTKETAFGILYGTTEAERKTAIRGGRFQTPGKSYGGSPYGASYAPGKFDMIKRGEEPGTYEPHMIFGYDKWKDFASKSKGDGGFGRESNAFDDYFYDLALQAELRTTVMQGYTAQGKDVPSWRNKDIPGYLDELKSLIPNPDSRKLQLDQIHSRAMKNAVKWSQQYKLDNMPRIREGLNYVQGRQGAVDIGGDLRELNRMAEAASRLEATKSSLNKISEENATEDASKIVEHMSDSLETDANKAIEKANKNDTLYWDDFLQSYGTKDSPTWLDDLTKEKKKSEKAPWLPPGIEDTGLKNALGHRIRFHKDMTPIFLEAMDTLAKEGIHLQISDNFRYPGVQKEAYESGKFGVAHPDSSFHPLGKAFDLLQTEEQRDNPRIAEVLSGLGLVQSALDKGEWWHWSTRE